LSVCVCPVWVVGPLSVGTSPLRRWGWGTSLAPFALRLRVPPSGSDRLIITECVWRSSAHRAALRAHPRQLWLFGFLLPELSVEKQKKDKKSILFRPHPYGYVEYVCSTQIRVSRSSAHTRSTSTILGHICMYSEGKQRNNGHSLVTRLEAQRTLLET